MSEFEKGKCRTCLNINTRMQSLNAKPKMLHMEKSYKSLLQHLTKLMVDPDKEDKISQRICIACSKKICNSYKFIEKLHDSHIYWMTIIGNSTNAEKYDKLDTNAGDLKFANKTKEEENKETKSDSTYQSINMNHIVSKELGTDIKTETNGAQKNEMYSKSVIEETEYDKMSEHSDIGSSQTEQSKCDPLEAFEDIKPDSLEDELLPVRCEECERIFENSFLLNRHKKDTHLPEDLKIQCPNCSVKFSRRYNMYAHMRTFHRTETVREHQLQPRKLTKTDVCEQCQRAYSDKYKLMAHIKSKHGPESTPKKPKQPAKQYLCTLCGLTCTNKSNLEIHYRRRHTGEKPFKCDSCFRCFTRSYELKVHIRTHTGESPYKCSVCEKAFKRSNKLKIHMRIHTNERPYQCAECLKAFRESKDLNIHRRTHTGERPYKCKVCQSTFTQSNSLKLHEKRKNHFKNKDENL